MATNISIPTYGFVNHILALNEGNWRTFFKPFITDSVQNGLATIEGANMTVYVSAGECRCGAVMGILDEMIALDIANSDSTYDRIDSVVVQYTYGEPSTLAVAIVQGTPSANPVPPTLTKVYDTLWQMEIAQILVPSGATSSSEFTITDKRVIYESIESIIDDNTESEDRVWSSQKTHEEIVSLSTEIYDSLNTKADAIERTTSGDIVTITDGADNIPVKELVAGIDPVQDLHGYDNPWPAGGGKNLWDYTRINPGNGLTITLSNDGFITITGVPTVNYAQVTQITNITGILEDGADYTLWMSTYDGLGNILYPQIVATKYDTTRTYITANGSNREFTVDKTTYESYTIYLATGSKENWGESSRTITERLQLEKNSSATSWTPYSNICPISGHSTAVVTRTGKNLVAGQFSNSTQVNCTLTVSGNTVTANGGNATVTTFKSNEIDVTEGATYKLTGCPSGGGTSTYRLDIRDTAGNIISNLSSDTGSGATVTIPSGYTKIKVGIRIAENYQASNLVFQPSLVLASSVQTVTISLGEERYGGTLDVLAGTLTITHGIVDLGDLTWKYQTGQNSNTFYSSGISSLAKGVGSLDDVPDAWCSTYKVTSWRNINNNNQNSTIGFAANSAQLRINDTRYTEGGQLETALSGQKLVYELATKTTVPLSANTLSLLLGENNLWSDTGDILNLTYRADTKTYIEQKVADTNRKTCEMMTIVTDKMIAPNNLTVGDLVIVNDDLYKVINSNIASGEAMVVGTNVMKITLAEYIQSLI